MPSCVPACYGLIGVVQRKGQAFASTKVLRKSTIDQDDVQRGSELRSRIYGKVGNSEIFGLMDKYFTDLCRFLELKIAFCLHTNTPENIVTCSTVVTWGYLIAKTNEEVFQAQESHLIIASAIMALGATRQTKSHIKATLSIGNSVDCVKTVMNVIGEIAEWADRPISSFDVDKLAQEIQ